jgi:Phage integrase family/Arm DNA-binding domain
MPRSKLTQENIFTKTSEGKAQHLHWDADTQRLALRVSAGGSRSFVWQGPRPNEKGEIVEKRDWLGSVEDMTLEQARERARELNHSVGSEAPTGVIPRTIGDAVKQWLAENQKHWRPATLCLYQKYAEQIPQAWLTRPLTWLRPEHIKQRHEAMTATNRDPLGRSRRCGGEVAANAFTKIMRNYLNYARAHGWLHTSNPAMTTLRQNRKGVRLNKQEPRELNISKDELARFDRALGEYARKNFSVYVYILGLRKMGFRAREWREARWDWLRLDNGEDGLINLPRGARKNHGYGPLTLRLRAGLLAAVKRLPSRGVSPFLFPDGDEPMEMPNGAFNTVLKHAGLTRDKLWPHGLRHQFVDDCVDAGIDALVILRLIGDADIGLIEKVYNRRQLEPKLAALAALDRVEMSVGAIETDAIEPKAIYHA